MRRFLIAIGLWLVLNATAQTRFVQYYDTITALKAATPNPISTVAVVKYGVTPATVDTGGVYYYDPTSIVADDGITIVKPNNGVGRWFRGNAPAGGVITDAFDAAFFTTNGAGQVSIVTNKTIPSWVNVKDPPYNALGDANANDTAAIQLALNSVPSSNGATIYFPKGTYLHDGLTLTNDRVQILGDGYGSILKRRTGGTKDALLVNAQQFQMRNIRMEAGLTLATNVNSSLCLSNNSDSIVEGVWFFGDWDQVKVFYGNNHRFANNIFEASYHNGIWTYQSFLDFITHNAFYNEGNGIDDGSTNTTAAVLLQSDPAYSFHSFGTVIADNIFHKQLFAHSIHATNFSNLTIVGNVFNLSGTFDPGTKDDICLRGVTNAAIIGNISTATNNDYIPGNRASRWAVNTDSKSDYIEIYPATMLQTGIAGKINNNVVHMQYSDMSLGTLMQAALTVPKILTTGGTAADVTDPALRILNNRFITFLDSSAGYSASSFLWLDNANNFHIGVSNLTFNGLLIDTNGNWYANTATAISKYNFKGSLSAGPNQLQTITDNGTVGIFQQNNHDWEWFNSSNGKIAALLTKDGQFVLSNTNAIQIKDTSGVNENTVVVDGGNTLNLSSPTIGGGMTLNIRKGDQTFRLEFATNTVVMTAVSNLVTVLESLAASKGILVTGGVTNLGSGTIPGQVALGSTNGANFIVLQGRDQLNATITNSWPGTNVLGFALNDGTGNIKWDVNLVDDAGNAITNAIPIRGPLGSATSPTYSWSGETNTGMYSLNVGDISFALQGNRLVFVNSTPSFALLSDAGGYFIGASTDVNLKRGSAGTFLVTTNLIAKGTLTATNGVASYSTTAAVNIAATGWTNTFGINAMVYYDGTAVTATLQDGSGSGIYTNASAIAHGDAMMQPNWRLILSGTGVTGRAVPF